MSQLDRVRYKLINEGKISRNFCLDLPFEKKITRLSAHIKQLKNIGYAIETKEENNDCTYYLKGTPEAPRCDIGVPKVEYQKVYRNGEWVMLKHEIKA